VARVLELLIFDGDRVDVRHCDAKGVGAGCDRRVERVQMAFASRWLLSRLQRLRAETGLNITVEAADLPVDLHASNIDRAIRYAHQPDGKAQWQKLFSDAILPVCAPDLFGGSPPLTPEGLLALPLLHYRWQSTSSTAPSWERWHAPAGAKAAPPSIAQSFSEEIHALDAAVSGQGAALASQHLVADVLKAGQLVQLSDIALPGLSYWAVFLATHPAKARLVQLSDRLRLKI
jgi:LysR family transcriptional regulator, glycine cleavage system transcriptional activator